MSLSAQRNDSFPLSDDGVYSDRNPVKDLTVGTIVFLETLVGTLGNFSLLHHYMLLNIGGIVNAINLIIMHLAVSNFLIIIFKGVPQTMETFGLKNFLNDLGCHFLLYVQRVGRGVSIGLICLLSAFQAIIINPMHFCWKDQKVKAAQYVTVTGSISLCWIYHITVNLFSPSYMLYVSSHWNMKNVTSKGKWWYCYKNYIENVSGPIYLTFIVFPEIVFSVLTVWTSGSTMMFLYRHKQRVQHIHRNHVPPRSSAESRAIQITLVLVSIFVCFHTLSSLINMAVSLANEENELLISIGIILSLYFPAVSPFLVMRRDSKAFRLSVAMIVTRK